MYGNKIQTIRTLRGYSQEYMATKLGIAQTTYSKLERDETKKIDDELLKKIAQVLGVPEEELKNIVPIVMNFQVNKHSNLPHGLQQNNVYDEMLQELKLQLHEKDDQIKKLIELCGKK